MNNENVGEIEEFPSGETYRDFSVIQSWVDMVREHIEESRQDAEVKKTASRLLDVANGIIGVFGGVTNGYCQHHWDCLKAMCEAHERHVKAKIPVGDTGFRRPLDNYPMVTLTPKQIDKVVEQSKDIPNGYDNLVNDLDEAELGKLSFALRRQIAKRLDDAQPTDRNGVEVDDRPHLKSALDAADECARSLAHTFVGEGSLPIVK